MFSLFLERALKIAKDGRQLWGKHLNLEMCTVKQQYKNFVCLREVLWEIYRLLDLILVLTVNKAVENELQQINQCGL
jgi:hypothetical protein